MKFFVIYLFLALSVILISCNQGEGIIISAKIPTNNIEEGLVERNSPYIPPVMLDYLFDNAKINFGVLAPGRNLKTQLIEDFNVVKMNNGLGFEFTTALEEGDNRVLVFKVGDKNFKEETPDANTEHLFTDGILTPVKDGLNIDMTLQPIFNFSGDIITDIKEGEGNSNDSLNQITKLKIYPSVLDKKGDFDRVLKVDSKSDGSFDFFSVYSKFKQLDRLSSLSSNVIITATQGDKIGFTLASKEYFNLKDQKILSDENVDFKDAIINEKKCYDAYSMYYDGSEDMLKSDCLGVNSICLFNENMDALSIENKLDMKKCFFTQSGNLLPGVKLQNDIKLYKKSDLSELLSKGDYLISGVSSPKFAKDMTTFDKNGLEYEWRNTYYGNFFITGFNLPQIFLKISIPNPEVNHGTIRIYYDVPDKIKQAFTDEGSNSLRHYNGVYLEYKGPFSLYKVAQRISELTETTDETWVLQNRLPFFKIWVSYIESQDGEKISYMNYPISHFLDGEVNNISEFLELSDGGTEKTFLGIMDLEKQISGFKVLKVEFSPMLDTYAEGFNDSIKVIYSK